MKETYQFVALKSLTYRLLLSICTLNFLRLLHLVRKLNLLFVNVRVRK